MKLLAIKMKGVSGKEREDSIGKSEVDYDMDEDKNQDHSGQTAVADSGPSNSQQTIDHEIDKEEKDSSATSAEVVVAEGSVGKMQIMADVENDGYSVSAHPLVEHYAGTAAYTGQEDNNAARD
ncbi:hypothetical protein CY34DRAFT_108822 [Suillus luteus UH-Slu-Lm8-n1]|uniref:Uncharacterized protein n=1 Tax=Suillus luteus UH-Slu-Lm8-n1 TaxID=930992 RepID=A0A0D0A8P9_9AGAM|nr:hypothetical protein CY34DRAFT_108822 [Suillus luteus UH-Slu-Lm8-n1]